MNDMPNMDNKRARAREIWSLRPAAGCEDVPAPLVLLYAAKPGAIWRALPLLDDRELACNRDIRLSDDPDWLSGVCWCAAKDALDVPEDSLWNRLEDLDPLLFRQVKSFVETGQTSLLKEVPLIPALDDPRIQMRGEFFDLVRRCSWPVPALAPLLKVVRRAKGEIEVLLNKGTQWTAIPANPVTAAFPALRGPMPSRLPDTLGACGAVLPVLGALSAMIVRPASVPAAYEVPLSEQPYTARLRVEAQGDRWGIVVFADVDAVYFSQGTEVLAMREFGKGRWIHPTEFVPPGKYALKLKGGSGMVEIPLELAAV